MGKLKASTLIESIVSLTLVITITGIAILVIPSVVLSANLKDKMAATIILEELAHKNIAEQNLFDNTFKSGKYTVTQTISVYNGNADILRMHLQCNLPGTQANVTYDQLIPRLP